jgi:hypothetical protein
MDPRPRDGSFEERRYRVLGKRVFDGTGDLTLSAADAAFGIDEDAPHHDLLSAL